MKSQALWYLENIDLTGVFCPNKYAKFEKGSHIEKVFKKGEYIYLPEDSSDKIYFLMDGMVKIGTYGDSGKEITKAILGGGEVFGELAIVGEGKRRDFAYAMEDTHACEVTVEEMKSLFRDHNGLELFMMRIFGSRLLQMEQRLESMVFRDSRSRIIDFLLEYVKSKGQPVGYEHVVRRFMTHQEIANLTATSRQTVTTVLNELRNKNLLTFNRRRLLIRNMELLQKEAG